MTRCSGRFRRRDMQRVGFAVTVWLCCLALVPVGTLAQVRIAGAAAPLAAPGPAPNTLSLSASAPGGVLFNLVPLGNSPGNQPVSISASWDLVDTLDWVWFVAYFDDATAALQAGNKHLIPSAAVSGTYNCINAKGRQV